MAKNKCAKTLCDVNVMTVLTEIDQFYVWFSLSTLMFLNYGNKLVTD